LVKQHLSHTKINRIYDGSDDFICIDDDGRHTMAEIRKNASNLWDMMQRSGIQPGECIGIVCENNVRYLEAILAIFMGQCICVPLPASLSPDKIAKHLVDVNARALCISGQYPYDCFSDSFVAYYVDNAQWTEYTTSNRLIYSENSCLFDSDVAFLLLTSGTTSHSKAVVLSHTGTILMVDAICDYMMPKLDDTFFVMKNVFHVSTLIGEILTALRVGCVLSLRRTSRLLPRKCIENMKKDKVSILFANPTLLRGLMHHYVVGHNIESCRLIYTSGAPLSEKMHRSFQETFKPAKVYNVYGLTEAGPRVCAQRVYEEVCYGSVGKPINNVDVCILCKDETGKSFNPVLKPYEQGQLFVKSRSLMIGYFFKGKLEYCKTKEGYFETGDTAYFNEEGNYFIVGRSDDVIIKNSINIIPNNIDDCLYMLDDIKHCITFGAADSECNQKIVTVYSTKSGQEISRKTLNKHMVKYLKSFEFPNEFVFSKSIPLSDNGKIKRYDIIKSYTERDHGF